MHTQDGSLIRLDEAVAMMRSRLSAVTEVETVALTQALGRVLSADQVATLNVPAFDASAMDGWAVRAADLGRGALAVGGRIAAGHPLTEAVLPERAYRIFTGAPVPPGLDTVIMQEDARCDGDMVWLPQARAGANIRAAGEAVTVGDVTLAAGTLLRPQHVGVAATLGLARLPVRRRLRVAVFSTGDELREPGAVLPPGATFDANRASLRALLSQLGCEVSDLGILADRPEVVRQALAQAAPAHDLIVTSGGVSVGDEDHVKAAVQALGQLDFWRLALKPGKPLALGHIGDTVFLGLPGNPVAVMVAFLLVGREVVAALAGATLPPMRRYRLPAAFSLDKKAGRREFPRARLTEDGTVELFRTDSSGVLTSMTEADGLVDLPEDAVHIRPGDPVAFLPFSEVMP